MWRNVRMLTHGGSASAFARVESVFIRVYRRPIRFFASQTSLNAWPTVAAGPTAEACKKNVLAADERR
jgi:hypothetical protein